ncbi:unnamed protein product, partial [Vitis vinifera]
MEVVGESVLSAAVEVLFGNLASPELLKFARQGEVIAELENWKKELMMINEVLDEAEEKQTTKPSVKNWLDDLRDLAYDMEDVLDELATELLRRRLKAEGADQVATTNDISSRKAKLAASTWQRPPTTSLINEPVHGRDDEKEVIIEMLLKDEGGESNFGVIPIVGIGGMGKTTLAQLIYRDDEIVKHFEPTVWVCVSDESDVEKLTKIILNAVSPDEMRDGDDFNQVLGGLLRSKPQNQWEHVLSSKMWNRKLILLWMAEGLIHEAEEEKCQMEDLGADYFDELLSRCFFQPSSNSKSQFIMHDLINDLAQDVATEICFNLENIRKASEMTRHLSFIRSEYDVFKKFEVLNKPEQLRTFVALPITVDNKMKCYLSTKVLHGLLPKLIQLRVLSLSGYEINELPNSIGDLKHLRYLNLSHTKLKWLPEAVSSLYNLQSLILCNCMELIKLPICIMNLTNLRHLDISGSIMLEEMPPQVGSLVNLQTLSKFFLSKDNGSRIKELKNLLNLRGELAILGLENVSDPRDAMYVNFKEIPNIEDLIMVWSEDSGNSRNESTEIEVLKWLQPHQSLKKLGIAFYGGSKFPHWIGDPSFSKMVCLELIDCKNCTSLPALGGLPFLKDLVIKGMNQVKSIGDGFYGDTANPFQSLESLRFENMAEWNNWLIPKLGHEETEALFPCLHELIIIKCPKLINLPHELPSLVVFHVKECQELEMSIPRLPLLTQLIVVGSLKMKGCSNLEKLPNALHTLASLAYTIIHNCPKLVSFPETGLPPMLRDLRVRNCEGLETLPDGMMINSCALEQVEIRDCPSLIGFPKGELPVTLKNLLIENCEKLESLPEGIDNNNTCRLEKLHVCRCPSLKSIPRGYFPSTLEILSIWDCEQLESIPGNLLQNLTSLRLLNICNCPDVVSSPEAFLNPNLKQLYISDCENMRWPLSGWGLRTLTSLDELVIRGPFPDLLSFSGSHLLLPTSLTHLGLINLPNLKSVTSMGLRSLMSLKRLEFHRCPKLRSFVPKEGLPPTLARLLWSFVLKTSTLMNVPLAFSLFFQRKVPTLFQNRGTY